MTILKIARRWRIDREILANLTARGGLTLALALCLNSAAVAADVEAYVGQPFGVGRVTLPISANGPVVPLEDERFTVESPDGRVLYPVLMEQRTRRLLRQLLEIESPRMATIYFLFRGDQPFQLNAFAPTNVSIPVTPQSNPQAHRALLDQWWREYGNRWSGQRQSAKFPPVVENFLAANLSHRLQLPLPKPSRGLFAGSDSTPSAFNELMLSESHLMSLDQQLLLSADSAGPAEQPLPRPMPWYELPVAEDLEEVPVEPIATHVPVEAFYLRFGNFSNYYWFRSLSRKWQGDLGNMISRRAIDQGGSKRLEQQLSLQESVLAQFLGPQVIDDVAIIGLDPYLNDNAAVGILFQAKNTSLLTQDLNRQRRNALTKLDAVESSVRIADRDVSLIATPDNSVRSFYCVDGDFHLVTPSRQLVLRFIQASGGDRSLAASSGFRTARKRLSIERTDAVFAYISPEFFRELTSPAIWIETQRRARTERAAKLLTMARLQAAAEGHVELSNEQLVAKGIVPSSLVARLVARSNSGPGDPGQVPPIDDVLGFSIPIADVEVTGVTAEEAADYQNFANRFRQEVGQTPPIAAGIYRIPLEGGGESLSIDLLATPLKDVKLGRLPDTLGEPSDQRTAPVAGDMIHGEFVLDSPLPLTASEPHHLVVGVRDFRSPLVAEQGQLAPGAPPAELVRMYVATWPKPGGLIKLLLGDQLAQGPEPVAGRQDTWQAAQDDFLLISFKPEVVEQVLPQLKMEPAEQPGQAWIDIADLTGTELSKTINAFGYMRARETSVAACRLMNTLANQLHVAPEKCREVAEQLMEGSFICPLGGEYVLTDVPNGKPMWTSTAITPENRFLLTAPPEDFQLALLTWFRGLRAEARLDGDAITAHLEVDMDKSGVP